MEVILEYWQTYERKWKFVKVNYYKLLSIIQYLLADFQKSRSLFILCDELLILHEITNWHHNETESLGSYHKRNEGDLSMGVGFFTGKWIILYNVKSVITAF